MDRGYIHKTMMCISTLNKDYTDDKIPYMVEKYSGVIRELLEVDPDDELRDHVIVIKQAYDQDNNEYIDVHLEHIQDGTSTAIDFIDWAKIVDLPIRDDISREVTQMLAHVLYELTWWGFTRESVKQQGEELLEIANDKQNLIEFSLSAIDVD